MKHILIDCDPGHDDALAILTALANAQKLNIIGITTVGGNQTLAKVTQNAKNVLSFVSATIPLAMGQKGPLVKEFIPSDEAHGQSGMDGPYFKDTAYPIVDENAVHFMYKQIMSVDEKVTIVGLAPLTNIAILLKSYPEIHEKIEAISLMGGGLTHGNMTALAEFNIYIDPEAAHIVFNSNLPIIMAGLDVTEKAAIKVSEIQALKNKGPVSHLAYELLHFYNQSGRQFGFEDSPIHDLCAIAYLLKPALFTGTHYFVTVDTNEGIGRGHTFADKRLTASQKKNTLVLEDVDREGFVELLVKALEKLDEEIAQ
ncbi:nucleoside hydrolase [Vagococcus acidifermentans]|uniref:Pyrimidine-specific ribonucleoside hydrolase RihA n=1 Tax=Vagococcus acidifermentans TaxID=564710 RepID=A0A430AX10_9ENTE|nr:nucleoside hydrolase [Vagococcus acidifermentans]RSU12576.1 pyrimidine-specific ribonucleoside hydrolase RihA [Vagococcus acidifermentans]